MPSVSPKVIFWISFFVTLGTGISGGAVHLTNIVPPAYMDGVTAWVSLGVFIGSTFLTMATAAGMTKQSVLSAAAAVPEVQRIVTTPELADALPSEKVVAPPPPAPIPAVRPATGSKP